MTPRTTETGRHLFSRGEYLTRRTGKRVHLVRQDEQETGLFGTTVCGKPTLSDDRWHRGPATCTHCQKETAPRSGTRAGLRPADHAPGG